MTDELTKEQMLQLLGVFDRKNADDYDREFYETMCRLRPKSPVEIDDKIRRTIMRFIMEGKGVSTQGNNAGLVLMGFVHGYLVGRKLRRDIRRK